MSGENVLNGFRQAETNSNAPFLNGLNTVMQSSFVIAPGAANICTIQITMKDGSTVPVANTGVQPFKVWLSDSAVGLGLTATTASGVVVGTVGNDFFDFVAKKLKLVQPNALGVYTLSITDTAKTGFYIALQNQYTGQVTVSRQLLTADYG